MKKDVKEEIRNLKRWLREERIDHTDTRNRWRKEELRANAYKATLQEILKEAGKHGQQLNVSWVTGKISEHLK